MAYLTLFFASLLAATLLPGGSEALLLYDLSQSLNIWLLFISATLGNTLGSIINYILGRKGIEYLLKNGYTKQKDINRADKLFAKYGAIVLLFSWMPIIGDPITFVAGVLKYRFRWFVFLVLCAKGLRYLVIIWLKYIMVMF